MKIILKAIKIARKPKGLIKFAFHLNKAKLILNFFTLPVLAVFLIAATCAGCRSNISSGLPVKTPEEAYITIAGNEDITEEEDVAKNQYKKMLPEPVVQDMPYYYIAVLNCIENRNNAEEEIDKKIPHLIEMVNTADLSSIKLTLMFCPLWAEMFYQNSSRLALIGEWRQNGHEISCWHRSIYSADWDGYTDLPYDEALKARNEITDNSFENEYAGNMADYINKLKMINSDIKSGYVQTGKDSYSYKLLRSSDFAEKNNISDQIIYYTYTGCQDFNAESAQNGDPGYNDGLNKYIISLDKDDMQVKYLSHLNLESKQDLDSAIKTFGAYDSSYVFGLAVLNDINFLKYYFSLLQYIQALDPEGLNSKTITQIMEGKILQETSQPGR